MKLKKVTGKLYQTRPSKKKPSADMSMCDSAAENVANIDVASSDVAVSDSAVRNVADRDVAGRDVYGKDITDSDVVVRVVAGRDVAGGAVAGRDVAGRDVAVGDAADRDVADRDAANRDVAGRGVAGRGVAVGDAADRDVADRDAAVGELYKMKLSGNYDYNQKMILIRTVREIQVKYEINPKIINKWISSDDFLDKFNNVVNKSFVKVIKEPNNTLDKLSSIINEDKYVEDNLSDEKLKCGMILDEYNNGYVKYCNKHQYEHNVNHKLYDDRLSKELVNKVNRKDNQCDHVFVSKTGKEILEEQIFKIKYNIYRKFVNQASHNLFLKFIEDVKKDYRECYVNSYYLDQVVEWLRQSPMDFVSKNLHNMDKSDEEAIYVKLYMTPKSHQLYVSNDKNQFYIE